MKGGDAVGIQNTMKALADPTRREILNLLKSGGSDYHGQNQPTIHLGSGTGSLEVPYEYLEAIREHLKK